MQDANSGKTALSPLTDELESAIQNYPLTGTPDELYAPMRYIMELGGKRVRPQLVALGADLFGGSPLAPVGGLLVELFHNFTLMHDDLMDRSSLRRGKPTVHEHWDAPTAILSGDAMLVKAYELCEQLPAGIQLHIQKAFSQCALRVVEGQQLDMNFEKRDQVSEPEYLEMIRLKTAVLIGFSLWLGATMAGATPTIASRLQLAGERMGVGFQLYDDYLDTFGQAEQIGKKVGGDILANKKTILVIKALAALETPDAKQLTALLIDTRIGDEVKIAEVKKLFSKAGADVDTANLSRHYYEQGLAMLREENVDATGLDKLCRLVEQMMYRQK